MTQSEKKYLLILILTWLLVHVGLLQYFGIRELFDARDYTGAADYLIQYGRLEESHHIFYVIPVFFMAVFRALFPGTILPFLIFQSLISCAGVLALYFSATKIFQSTRAGLITGLFFLGWWDNIHWNITAMTESLASSAGCFLIYSLVLFQDKIKNYLVIILLLVGSFFIRPTGILLILASIAFMIHYHWSFLKGRTVLRLILFTSIFFIGFIGASMMLHRWDFTDQLMRGNIVTYVDTIKGSNLYDKSLQLDTTNLIAPAVVNPVMKMLLFIWNNPVYFFKSSCLKIWYLLSFIRPYYSLAHNVFSFTWAASVYLLFFFGFRKQIGPIKIFAVTVLLVNCCLIGISTVDWDNRFFIPMEPILVLMAGGGADALWTWISKQRGFASR